MVFERIKEENIRKVEYLQSQEPDYASVNLNNKLEFAQKVEVKTCCLYFCKKDKEVNKLQVSFRIHCLFLYAV